MIPCCTECLKEEVWKETINNQRFVAICTYCNQHKFDCIDLAYVIDFLRNFAIDQWIKFHNKIQYEQRFILDNNFEGMINLIKNRYTRILFPRTTLYRGRLGGKTPEYSHTVIEPYEPLELLTPPPNLTQGGRANPVGIPYLYTAFDLPTTIAELRPWKNADISLLTMLTKKELVVADFSNIDELPVEFIHPKRLPEIIPNVMLNLFGKKIAEPINPSLSHQSYILTQYFSELIKISGFDGMIYKSTLGPGNNLVIFKAVHTNNDFGEIIEVLNVELYKVGDVRYQFQKMV